MFGRHFRALELRLDLFGWVLDLTLGPAVDEDDTEDTEYPPFTVIDGDGCDGCDECDEELDT